MTIAELALPDVQGCKRCNFDKRRFAIVNPQPEYGEHLMTCPRCARKTGWARMRCPACRTKLVQWYLVAGVMLISACYVGLVVLDQVM
jgi:hypothetical protein